MSSPIVGSSDPIQHVKIMNLDFVRFYCNMWRIRYGRNNSKSIPPIRVCLIHWSGPTHWLSFISFMCKDLCFSHGLVVNNSNFMNIYSHHVGSWFVSSSWPLWITKTINQVSWSKRRFKSYKSPKWRFLFKWTNRHSPLCSLLYLDW